jgi:putative ABC transport system substrate-binding protein
MTDRRTFLVSLGGLLWPTRFVAEAQAPRMFRVAVLSPNVGPPPGVPDTFRKVLADLGYVEGRNLILQIHWMGGRESEYPTVLASLAGNVDVVAVATNTAALAARRMSETTPVVFSYVSDPVGLGLVKSLARPGGNMTGIADVISELVAKRLEMLRELLPGVSKVAVLVGSDTDRVAATEVRDVEAAARTLHVVVGRFIATNIEEFDAVAARIARERFGAVIVTRSYGFYQQRAQLVAAMAKHRLPASYFIGQFAELGGLMTYAPHPYALNTRAAELVAKILGGAKPADLPVEQPTKFELVINMKTAKTLGLTVPPTLLLRADRIIE